MRSRTTLLLALAAAAALAATPAVAAPGRSSLGNVNQNGQSATFSFSQVSGSTWYYLWIDGPSGLVHKKWYRTSEISCDGQTCTISPSASFGQGRHKWWVQTWDASGAGPWSNPDEFDMGGGQSASGTDLDFDLDPSVGAPIDTVHWIDHLAFRPGSEAVAVSFDAFDSGVGGGVSGLKLEAGAIDDVRVIEQGLAVPPGFLVDGVRLCVESTGATAFIDEVRIEQLNDPPSTTQIVLLDPADAGGVAQCVDSAAPAAPIDPSVGALRLQLGVVVPAGERVVVRAVGLQLTSDDDDPVQRELQKIKQALESVSGHTHHYLTGRGNGHNNTKAVTGGPVGTDAD